MSVRCQDILYRCGPGRSTAAVAPVRRLTSLTVVWRYGASDLGPEARMAATCPRHPRHGSSHRSAGRRRELLQPVSRAHGAGWRDARKSPSWAAMAEARSLGKGCHGDHRVPVVPGHSEHGIPVGGVMPGRLHRRLTRADNTTREAAGAPQEPDEFLDATGSARAAPGRHLPACHVGSSARRATLCRRQSHPWSQSANVCLSASTGSPFGANSCPTYRA